MPRRHFHLEGFPRREAMHRSAEDIRSALQPVALTCAYKLFTLRLEISKIPSNLCSAHMWPFPNKLEPL